MRRAIPQPHGGTFEQDAQRRQSAASQRSDRAAYDADRTIVTDASGGTRLSVTTTATKFFHQLKREPVYLRTIYRNTDLRVWPTAWDSESVTLDCNGTGTVSVEVF